MNLDEKAKSLSNLRNESLVEVYLKYPKEVIKSLPLKYPRYLKNLSNLVIKKSWKDKDLAYIMTSDNKIFANTVGIPYHHNIYEVYKDKISKNLNKFTFLGGLDYCQRYEHENWIPKNVKENKNYTIIEVGSFLGHKAIKLSEKYLEKNNSKYIAIEMVKENFQILKKNISLNNLENVIIPLNYGISNSVETRKIFTKGRQRASIKAFDNVGYRPLFESKITTLTKIIKNYNLKAIDFLYVTVNGAEWEVLDGALNEILKFRVILIVSKYDIQNHQLKQKILEKLISKGFLITQKKTSYLFVNTNFKPIC